jgi:SET domain-containing protein
MKKDRLYFSSKIELRKSPIHGWGVFAKADIYQNEVLEEIPFLILPINKGESSSLFIDYRYNFPCGNWKYQVMPMGFACYYNHSNIPNAGWYSDEENDIFVFVANKNIAKDEEIFTYYGDVDYWKDGRENTQVK